VAERVEEEPINNDDLLLKVLTTKNFNKNVITNKQNAMVLFFSNHDVAKK